MRALIEKLDNFGNGITYYNDKIVFIPKTIPGDEVEFEIIKEHKKFHEGRLIKIINSSSNRIKAKCPFYEMCGGCSLQNLDYEKTVDYKLEKVQDLIKKNKLNIENITATKNEKPWNYRNKLSLKVVDSKIGFYESGTHKLVEINKCLVAKDSINNILKYLPSINIKNGNITIRSNYNDEILLIIETSDKIKNIPIEIAKNNKLVGIVLNDKTIYGESHFIEIIDNIFYEVSFNSFFQINPYITKELFRLIKENIDEEETVLDLYCGVGALSLVEAKYAKKVIGIEVVQNAVLNALKNKKMNKIENAEFVLRDLSKGLDLKEKIDCIIIDPPRSGIDSKTMEWILNNKTKKIIYISCDPNTLIRDLKILNDYYNIKDFKILDMFSYSYHVESFVLLEERK